VEDVEEEELLELDVVELLDEDVDVFVLELDEDDVLVLVVELLENDELELELLEEELVLPLATYSNAPISGEVASRAVPLMSVVTAHGDELSKSVPSSMASVSPATKLKSGGVPVASENVIVADRCATSGDVASSEILLSLESVLFIE